MLRAIRSDTDSNVLATPSAVTMDNQEAELKVAQEVPFLTGSFANTGSGSGNNGQVNPFQTIQREEVGTILKITPQINEGGSSVMLKIELESSSLSESSQAVDLITNKRTISTNVLIEDNGIVVLGGLISDDARKGEQRVPFLGRIPVIGLAFKTRNASATKSNLMVFIKPKILRDGVQAAVATDSKYNDMREAQRKFNNGRELLPLLPGVPKPALPKAPPIPENTAPAPVPPSEVDPSRLVTPDGTSPQGAAPPPNPPDEPDPKPVPEARVILPAPRSGD
jgi:general secretion pathway protein D